MQSRTERQPGFTEHVRHCIEHSNLEHHFGGCVFACEHSFVCSQVDTRMDSFVLERD